MTDLGDLFRQIANTPAPVPVTHLIVGLGNPGKEYALTRHNAGFRAMDAFASSLGVPVDRLRFRALTGEARIGETRVLLMKPQTMMNASGLAVREAASFYRVPPEHILVLCDDISFAPGRVRIRAHGSCGGHNGLRSIGAELSSEEFPRIKLGVGAKPCPEYDLADWVLGRMSEEELGAMQSLFPKLGDAIRLLLTGDYDGATRLCST